MATKSTTSSGGVSFLGVLGIVFIALKLGNVIDWSWWYVTLPLWGGLALVLAIGALVGSVMLIRLAIK